MDKMNYKDIADKLDRILDKLHKKLDKYEEDGEGFLGDIIDETSNEVFSLKVKLMKQHKRFDSPTTITITNNPNQN
jgi:hypothetical protein